MSLISCPECGGKLSTAAEACPHCGHPAELITRPQATPAKSPEFKCYACSREATTRCAKCEAMSCPAHLNSIYVNYGKGGNYELRCRECYKEAEERKAWRTLFTIIAIVIAVIFFFGAMIANQQNHRFPRQSTPTHFRHGVNGR
jgi:hypothetical protein